jgi:hypothetical protein
VDIIHTGSEAETHVDLRTNDNGRDDRGIVSQSNSGCYSPLPLEELYHEAILAEADCTHNMSSSLLALLIP